MANGDGEANRNTVFIDTSLDTHLATIVSDSDTVSDLKQKILLEHRQCFPAIGDIKVHCLKVKRRGNFYHLSESMLVKSAFGAAKKNWFVSVDASRIEQDHGIQHMDKHRAGNQLALPWVTDCRSIGQNDSQADRPSNQSLVHGSSSMHPKIAPFVNQNAPNVDQLTSGDSCKDVSKNIEVNKSFNDDDSEKQLVSKVQEKPLVNNEIISKKRKRDVHNENLLEDVSGSGPSVKKIRKTQKIEANLKASENNIVVTYEENSSENKSKSKDLSDENTRIKEGENCSALVEVGVVVPPSVEDVVVETHTQKNTEVSEAVPEVAMDVEENIQQEMPSGISQKEKEDELVHKKVVRNEIPSSSMRTSDSEPVLPDVTDVGDLKGPKHSTKNKAAEKEVSSTSLIKNVHKVNKDAIDSSLQDVGSNGQESAVDQIDKRKETMGGEITGEGKRKRVKKSAVKKKDESLAKHADKKIVADVSTTVLAPVLDEKIVDDKKENVSLSVAENNEVSEKTVTDHVIVKEVEISEPTESHKSQVRVENMEEKSNSELKDTVGVRKKKRVGRSARKNDELIVKHTSEAATVTNEEKVSPQNDDILMENDAEISKTEINVSQVIAQVINDNSEKVIEKTDGTKKSKKKKKTKKSAGLDLEPVPEETSKSLTLAEVSKVVMEEKIVVNNEIDITNDKSHEIDFKNYFSPVSEQKTIASIDNGKDAKLPVREKKLKKKTKEPISVETSIQSQKPLSKNENKKPSKKTSEVSNIVVKDPNIPNIDEVKTPKRTRKIDPPKPAHPSSESNSRSESFGRSLHNQKSNKPQSTPGQTQVKTVKKTAPVVKNLLNTPGTIFGDDSDSSSANDNAIANSNSSTRTPSRKLSSSGDSESDSSIDSRRNGSRAVKRKEGGAKNNINSQSRMKSLSMADLLRSSSRFKKAKLSASQVDDTESQPVDFVPDTQPIS